MNRGYTVVELVAVLTLLATLLGLSIPPISAWRDRASVDSAAAELRSLLREARSRSLGVGAEVTLSLTPPTAELSVAGSTLRTIRLTRDAPIDVDFGGRQRLTLRFDAMGIGRFSAATIRYRFGSATRRVIVSSWGRVRIE
ncbi:MAG: GspH/FimT family pseudopilin [Gemmatimonadota bacterium]